MSHSFQLLPDGDVANDGWTLVGASVTKIWEAVSAIGDDGKYVRCPSYRGGALVKFPTDCDDLPAGAIIDSVTIFIRMRTNAGSGPRSVTVNVMSSQNMSRYTTRTLYATSTFTTFEVGTYQRDPLGYKWDIHRLNKLRLRIFSYNNLFDSVRIAELYCRVNYHVSPSVTVTAPTGTVNTPSPAITWAYQQEEGEPQAKAEYRLFLATQVNVSTFNPDTAPPVFSKTMQGEATTDILPTSLNPNSYYVYVRAWSVYGAKSSWARKAFTIVGPSPGVPGDDNAGVSGVPGVGVPTVIPDTFTSSAVLSFRDASNLLSVQQADFEIPADPIEYTGTNATLARSTDMCYGQGVASLKMTATGAGSMSAFSTFVDLAPGEPITARCQFRKATSGSRTANLRVYFYNEEYTELAGTVTGTGTSTNGTWTEVVLTGTSPVGTAYAKVEADLDGVLASEVHHIDHVGLMYGTNTAWSDGGHASRNLLSSFFSTGDDPADGGWVPANVATTVSRVATSGIGAHGSMTNRMSYVGASTSIAFRATGSVFTSPTSGTNYTLNKPAGVVDNDLLLAFVTSSEHSEITPPSGWTLVNTASVNDGTTDIALFILKRSGLAADPSTWTDGSLSVASSRRTAVVVAYSGAALAEEQFIAENVRTDSSGNLAHTTATVANTDPNAWRISAFAASDDVSGGTFVANTTPPSTAQPIAYVGTASKWSSATSSSSFTINRPANVKSGDLMIATFACVGIITTVTPPAGWTLVRKVTRTGTVDLTFAAFKRTAGASEPSSWAGSLSSSAVPRITGATAYRNCQDVSVQFVDEESSTDISDSQLSSGTVANTSSASWRVTSFAATRRLYDYDAPYWNSSENRERYDEKQAYEGGTGYAVNLSMFDSGNTVSTGDHSRTGYFENDYGSGSYYAAVGWIALLRGQDTPPAAGPNETERVDNNNGSSNPWMSTAVYDTNGVAPTGDQNVTGVLTPSSGTAANSMASWIGIIKPANSVQAGVVAAYTDTMVDIADLDPRVLELADNKLTFISHFMGSTGGTPTLSVDFYRANQHLSKVVAEGTVFDSSSWTRTWATFDIPEGTTRIRPQVGATGRDVGDTVSFDRVGLMLGSPADPDSAVWRNGTGRHEHPVWSIPVIEYADDDGTGYGPWTPLAGQKIHPPAFHEMTGKLTYVDHTIVPLHSRKYRIQTISYGLGGDTFASGFGPESDEVSFTALNWWLKDVKDLSLNMQLKVKAQPIQVGTTNTAVVFQPLGEDYPIVVSEGYKADALQLTLIMNRDEHNQLKRILNSGRTLLLQSDFDHSWWVRAVGDLEVETQLTRKRKENPIRFVTVTFVQVAPEE